MSNPFDQFGDELRSAMPGAPPPAPADSFMSYQAPAPAPVEETAKSIMNAPPGPPPMQGGSPARGYGGGYGAPPAPGGYGAPPAGGYGAPPGGMGAPQGGMGAPPPFGGAPPPGQSPAPGLAPPAPAGPPGTQALAPSNVPAGYGNYGLPPSEPQTAANPFATAGPPQTGAPPAQPNAAADPWGAAPPTAPVPPAPAADPWGAPAPAATPAAIPGAPPATGSVASSDPFGASSALVSVPGGNPYGAPAPPGSVPGSDPYGAPGATSVATASIASSDPYGAPAPPAGGDPFGAPAPPAPAAGGDPFGAPAPPAPAADPFSVFSAAPPSAPQPVPAITAAPEAVPVAPAPPADDPDDAFFRDMFPGQAPAVADGPAKSDGLINGQPAEADVRQDGELPPGGEWYDARIFTPTLGVMFFKPQELTDSLFLNTDRSIVDALQERPVVAFIVEGSSARSAGVELGHVLLKVNGVDVKNPKEASRLIKEGPRPLPLLFYVPDTQVVVAEGEHMVKYDTKETTAPNSAKDWKPKYVVIGGIIAQPWMMNMYRSKSEYDIAVIETQARRPVSVKVKQFSLQGARIQNDWQGPQMVKYKNKLHPWKYIVVLPVARNPIKISSPNLNQLKPVHEGIRRVLLAQKRDRGGGPHTAGPVHGGDQYGHRGGGGEPYGHGGGGDPYGHGGGGGDPYGRGGGGGGGGDPYGQRGRSHGEYHSNGGDQYGRGQPNRGDQYGRGQPNRGVPVQPAAF